MAETQPCSQVVTSRGSRPLRVCHVAYTFYENDNRVIRYAEALVSRGARVDVIALRREGQTRDGVIANVNVARIQRRAVDEKQASDYLFKILWFLVQATVVLSVRHLRHRYDVVHVHNVPDFLVFAAIVPRLFGARIILDIHDILPELYAGKFGVSERSTVFKALLRLERVCGRFADHVIVANHLWYDKLVARAVPRERCTTIMNYPDLSLFKPAASPRSPDKPFVFLYPGTLNHHQGVDIAVRAFAMVTARMPGAELHIYGEGPARRPLQELIEQLHLTDRLKLRDRVPLAEVASIMASAGAGVVPKRADGFGNEAFSTKILEFMACGVPVIVARTQVDAYYFDEQLVRFFTPGEVVDLAAAMLWVFEGRTEHAGWILRGREFAIRYQWQERVNDYLAIVENLMPSSAHHATVS